MPAPTVGQPYADRYSHIAEGRDEGLRTGAIVRLKPEYAPRLRNFAAGQPLVVFADKFEKVNCTAIGGDPGGRYYRIPATWVTVVDPASVTVA